MKHGDGAKDVAFEVEDCANLYKVRLYPGIGVLILNFYRGKPTKKIFLLGSRIPSFKWYPIPEKNRSKEYSKTYKSD